MEKYISTTTIRPWGNYSIVNDNNTFMREYFGNLNLDENRVSCKILLVNPNSKLSWQYHNRREEYWHIIEGFGKLFISDDDVIPRGMDVKKGQTYHILKTQRHRISTDNEKIIIAEIWHHVEEEKSDENDIVRVCSDY